MIRLMLDSDGFQVGLREAVNGAYMLYADHAAALAEKQEQAISDRAALIRQLQLAGREIAAYQKRERMVTEAMQRGTELYEAGHCRTVSLPSYDKMACWLIEQIAALKAQLTAMNALDRDGNWPSFGELALMFTEVTAERDKLRKALEEIKTRAKDLDEYVVENPAKVLDIPDEIYIPFMEAVGIKW